MVESFSNEELLNMLQSTETTQNNTALQYLHQALFKSVRHFIMENKGSTQDAEDVFQEGMFNIYKRAKQNKLHEKILLEPYLFSICKYLWWKKLKRFDKIESLKEEHQNLPEHEGYLRKIISKEQRQQLDRVLKQLGKDCHRILVLFYYNKMKMKQIIEHMNLSSEQVAKNKKSNCMKKLRTLVFQSEDFLGLR